MGEATRMEPMEDLASRPVDFSRRNQLFFRQAETHGILQTYNVTLAQTWHWEDEWHSVVTREESRLILLEFAPWQEGYSVVSMRAMYSQDRFPLFDVADVPELITGRWQGKGLDEDWHEEDTWVAIFDETFWGSEQGLFVPIHSASLGGPLKYQSQLDLPVSLPVSLLDALSPTVN